MRVFWYLTNLSPWYRRSRNSWSTRRISELDDIDNILTHLCLDELDNIREFISN